MRAAELLDVDASYMEKHLMDLSIDRKLILKEQEGEVIVYPSQYYYLELNTARMLNELNILCPGMRLWYRGGLRRLRRKPGQHWMKCRKGQ